MIFYKKLTQKNNNFDMLKNNDGKKNYLLLVIISLILFLNSFADIYAVTSDVMKDSITGLEKDLWGGVMRVIMVSGCIFGVGMSIFRQSLMPAGIGIGTALAGNFFKTWIEKGYAALI